MNWGVLLVCQVGRPSEDAVTQVRIGYCVKSRVKFEIRFRVRVRIAIRVRPRVSIRVAIWVRPWVRGSLSLVHRKA